jgi:8-oxo-dGTP pyrophosphatase MutT (NUDIX family)
VLEALTGAAFADRVEAKLEQLASWDAPRIPDAEIPDTFRRASVLVPLWRDGDRIRVLFTLRTQHLSSHRGEISFPGGRRDPADGSLVATALRETAEEVGIRASDVRICGRLDDAWSIQSYHVTPWVGWLDAPPRLVPEPGEIARTIVSDLETLLAPGVWRRTRLRRGDGAFDVHYYDLDGDVVWGLTGGIVYRFLAWLRDEPVPDATRPRTTLRRFLGGAE